MPSDPVNVELVGGTADTNPWHDHRVMLVSPDLADLLALIAYTGLLSDHSRRVAREACAALRAAPRVHADDDAIRWLTNRQGDAT